jgi:single-stranded-DNA-specific exonuclease
MALENVAAFKETFEKVVAESISFEDQTPEQEVDVELDFNSIFTSGENRMKIPRLKRILEQFEPHGPGNMKPVFLAKNTFSKEIRLLKDVHLKLSMTQPISDVIIEGIGFNLGDKIDDVAYGLPYDVVFTLETNKWRDRESLQLNIKDIRPVV